MHLKEKLVNRPNIVINQRKCCMFYITNAFAAISHYAQKGLLHLRTGEGKKYMTALQALLLKIISTKQAN